MTQEDVDWATRQALSIASEVRSHRLAQGLSAQQLSDRCASLGMPIQRSVIANLESGRRTTVTVAELVILAAALQVPPAILVFPVGQDVNAEVLPGAYQEPLAAVEWMAGHVAFSNEAADRMKDSPLVRFRHHDRVLSNLENYLERRASVRAELAEGEEARDRLNQEKTALEAELDSLRDRVFDAQESGSGALHSLRESLVYAEQQFKATATRLYQLEYLKTRADATEATVAQLEQEVKEIRQGLRDAGLHPPVISSRLSYLDPTPPFREDARENRLLDFADQIPDEAREVGLSRGPVMHEERPAEATAPPGVERRIDEMLAEVRERFLNIYQQARDADE